ncbi:hypothetical protein, partial [Rhodobacter ferrooxidans]
MLQDDDYIGQAARIETFGANILFDRDRVDNLAATVPQSSYGEVISSLGVGTLRYPGGSVSESILDIDNVDSSVQNGVEVTGLGDFLNFCAASRASLTMVMPTARFYDRASADTENPISDEDAESIVAFVTKLLNDALVKGVGVEAIELGNEWWGTDLSASEYGRLASQMSVIVQGAIDEFISSNQLPSAWVEPEILVQVGHLTDASQETQQIFDEFNTVAEQTAIDGLVTHRYLSGDFSQIGSPGVFLPFYGQFDEWDRLAESNSNFGNLSRHVSEWNVKANNDEERGLKSASCLVKLVAELLAADVDQANIWAIQQNNSQRLAMSTGLPNSNSSGLTINGEMFRLMSESVVGLRLVAHSRIDDRNLINVDEDCLTAFGGPHRVVVFISERNGVNESISLNVEALLGDFSHVWGTVLGTTDENPLDPLALPDLEILSGSAALPFQNGVLSFDLDPWETIRLIFTTDTSGAEISGHYDNDILSGSTGPDRIFGSAGNDRLEGFFGSDTLLGGEGDDVLQG